MFRDGNTYRAGCQAAGLEAIPSPFFQNVPGPASQAAEAIKSKAEAASDAFEKSDFLRGLREKSELNKDKYAGPHVRLLYQCLLRKAFCAVQDQVLASIKQANQVVAIELTD